MHRLNLLYGALLEDRRVRRQDASISRASMLTLIDEMDDGEFIDKFRLNKMLFDNLLQDLRTLTDLKPSRRICLESKVLCCLSFLATGSYQRIVGDLLSLTQPSASRCIREVVAAMSSDAVVSKWVKFPTAQSERTRIKNRFAQQHRIPGVIGAIDCTHVAIVKPEHEEHNFFNRKGYHSLNIQMVCDCDMRITNVNAKFGGATHDSYIWSSSYLETYMRQLYGNGEQAWLLGDSGYPLRPWLMTPILNAAPGSREESYTEKHVRARNIIERTFGVLKARWRCLLHHRTLHYDPDTASKIVLTCTVLHNICLNQNIPVHPNVEDLDENQPQAQLIPGGNQNELLQGRAAQANLILHIQ